LNFTQFSENNKTLRRLLCACLCICRDMSVSGDVDSLVHHMLYYFFDAVMTVIQVSRYDMLMIKFIRHMRQKYKNMQYIIYNM